MTFSILRMAASTSAFQLLGISAVVGVKIGADIGGDGESSRNGEANIAHFGEVRPFASQEVPHRGVAFGLAGSEEVNVLVLFGHSSNP